MRQELIKFAIEQVREKDGTVNPYRVCSYCMNLLDMPNFGLMADIRAMLGSPINIDILMQSALSHRYEYDNDLQVEPIRRPRLPKGLKK